MKSPRSGSARDWKEHAVSDQEREYKSSREAAGEGEEPDVELHRKAGRLANEDDGPDADADDFELHRKSKD
jgi:hypothetical protein